MVPIVRPGARPRFSAIFATTGLIVPRSVAGIRNVIVKCQKIRVGHVSSSSKLPVPIQRFTIGIVMQDRADRRNNKLRARRGR